MDIDTVLERLRKMPAEWFGGRYEVALFDCADSLLRFCSRIERERDAIRLQNKASAEYGVANSIRFRPKVSAEWQRMAAETSALARQLLGIEPPTLPPVERD